MTEVELHRLLERMTLPEGFCVQVSRWRHEECPADRYALELMKWREDVDSGKMGWGHGGVYMLEWNVTPSQVVQRVFKMLLAYEEHELRESFQLDGKRVLGPHPTLAEGWVR